MATLCQSTRSHFQWMVCESSLAQKTNQCGCGLCQQASSWMCSMATLRWSSRLHFQPIVHARSLVQVTNWFRCGIWSLTTSGSRPMILALDTPDGFFPQTDKHTSCLFHLMHSCLTLSISLLFLTPLLPLLISPMQPLGLDGVIVTVHSLTTLFLPPLTFL